MSVSGWLQETQMKWEEYEEIASSLVDWLQHATDLMLDRKLPSSFNELKVCIDQCLLLLLMLLMMM